MATVPDALKSLLNRMQPIGGEKATAGGHFETTKNRVGHDGSEDYM